MIGTVVRISWLNFRRDRVALALTFLLPIAFFSIFAGVFGEMDRGDIRPVSAVLVVEDLHPVSGVLARRLAEEPSLELVDLPDDTAADRSRALDLVRQGKASVGVVLPGGFGSRLANPEAGPAEVQLLIDRSHPVAGRLTMGLIQSALFSLRKPTGTAEPRTDGGPLSFAVVDVLGDSGQRPSVAFFASGIAVMFLMFSVAGRSSILIEERENGVLTRMLAAQVGITRLLVGRWLFLTLLGAAQVSTMFTWASLVFGLNLWTPEHLAGFAVVTAVTSATAAAFGLVLSTACRSRAQLTGVTTIVVLVLSALGGSMFPSFLMPEWAQRLGRLTFNSWAVREYQRLFWYDASIVDQWPQLAVIGLYGLVFLVSLRWLARRWQFV